MQHALGAKPPRLCHIDLMQDNNVRNKTFAPALCCLVSKWLNMRVQICCGACCKSRLLRVCTFKLLLLFCLQKKFYVRLMFAILYLVAFSLSIYLRPRDLKMKVLKNNLDRVRYTMKPYSECAATPLVQQNVMGIVVLVVFVAPRKFP